MPITTPMAGMGPTGVGMAPPMMMPQMNMLSKMAYMLEKEAYKANCKRRDVMNRVKRASPPNPYTYEPIPSYDDSGSSRDYHNRDRNLSYEPLSTTSPNLASALGIAAGGISGGMMGSMLGLPAGAVAGHTRGNTAEGMGRGLVRGGMTGMGLGGGSALGSAIASRLSGNNGLATLLGSLAGAGLGGYGGWRGSGALLGEPVGGKSEKIKKK